MPPLNDPPARSQTESKRKKVIEPIKAASNSSSPDPVDRIVKAIGSLPGGLQDYSIKDLVEQSESFGEELVKKGLKTNQIRKFLDAVNLLKAKLNKEQISGETAYGELHLLRPKLAYAARQNSQKSSPVEPFKKVLEAAIKKIRKEPEFFSKDFNRFSQLVESVIAYHKAAGGKNQ